ncbi:unnamed protein product [Darwinula stevensoni]|uniref:Chloride channel CLIC-like protein 1 n=1 Tax=Darwinula stevensoni TaxID=69355 RepID=A0A7R9A2E5_9CRUS|nr:unnamed protein product [Darwinula stevensoni]CAG0885505.1 unnamed protein product [Darwinula stevensoni]
MKVDSHIQIMFLTRSEYDRGVNTFSPEGRLFQVEYAIEAIKLGSTAIGIQTAEGVILAVEKRITSPLMEPTTIEKVVEIDKHVGCAVSGLIADARTMVDRARIEAQNHWFVYGEKMSVESVAQAVSNLAIQFGDSDDDGAAMSRPFGVAILFAGCDELGPQLYHMDPSGTFVQYDAKAIGSGSEGAQQSLKEIYHKGMTLQEALKAALTILKQVMEEKLNSTNVEVGAVTPTKSFHLFTKEQVEEVTSDGGDGMRMDMPLHLTADAMRILEAFLASDPKSTVSMSDVDEVLEELLNPGLRRNPGNISFTAVFGTFAVVSLILLIHGCLSGWTWRKLLMLFFISVFSASLLFNWILLYQKKLSERHQTLDAGIPSECQENRSFFFSIFRSIKANLFGAYGSRANCEEYMKALYVDPMLEVSPGVVVAETLAQFILHPLERMGSELAKFQGAIVSEVGWMGSIVVLALFIILVIVVLLVGCGYSFQVWPFIRISPTPSYQRQLSRQQPQAEEVIRQYVQDVLRDALPAVQHSQSESTLAHLGVRPRSQIAMHHESLAEVDPGDRDTSRRSLLLRRHRSLQAPQGNANDVVETLERLVRLRCSTTLPPSVCQQLEIAEQYLERVALGDHLSSSEEGTARPDSHVENSPLIRKMKSMLDVDEVGQEPNHADGS